MLNVTTANIRTVHQMNIHAAHVVQRRNLKVTGKEGDEE
jgi:hypothetical protein